VKFFWVFPAMMNRLPWGNRSAKGNHAIFPFETKIEFCFSCMLNAFLCRCPVRRLSAHVTSGGQQDAAHVI
jgi:hypothetical protein